MSTNFIVTTEVYSCNERRAELDVPPLAQDGFEYEVTLQCGTCGDVISEFDSQDGLQPFQICRDKNKAILHAEQTRLVVESHIANGHIDSWFHHIEKCSC